MVHESYGGPYTYKAIITKHHLIYLTINVSESDFLAPLV